MRWNHPERGLVPPAQFIPVAEDTGLILPIGRWVLREACRQAHAWQERFEAAAPITMSVNLSANQLQHPRLLDEVTEALTESGLAPEHLTLEITESVMMADIEVAASRLQELESLGVKLAIDDFGTGYSSLSYLTQFSVDVLKIDKSFVDGITRGPEESALARAIIKLGDALHLETVAEGIESGEQAIKLRELGCHRGQGYFLGKPLETEQFETRLRETGTFS